MASTDIEQATRSRVDGAPAAKTAIVTGAGHGIGRAAAVALGEAGFDVVVTYRSDDGGARETQQEVARRGAGADAVHLDVTDSASVEALFASFGDDEGPDVVVANACTTEDSLVTSMSDDQFGRVLDTCLYGSFSVFRAALPAMRRRRQGRLVAVSSAAAMWGRRGAANYAAAKAGVHGLVRSLAKETGRWGVTVNAVAPGVIDTGGDTSMDPSLYEDQLDLVALRRPGTPEDVASVIAFLASPGAAYITGEVVVVDGGIGP